MSMLTNTEASRSALEPGVTAWDGGLDVRLNASSVGLLSVRVAAAAARKRTTGHVNEHDVETLRLVSKDLREEAQILRHETAPDAGDETAYAFAGLALRALGAPTTSSGDDVETDEDAAARLDAIAGELEQIAAGSPLSDSALERIERVFFSANDLVSASIGRTGETLEGAPDQAAHTA